MSPSDEPESWLTAERLISRRYVRIPADQGALLERDEAWAENLRQGAYGLMNVPNRVLQDLKTFHSRKRAAPSPVPLSSPSSQSPASGAQRLSAAPQADDSPTRSDSQPSSQISWSPSPRPSHTSAAAIEPSKQAPPRLPLSRGKQPVTKALFLNDFPSSPAEDGDGELELEVPLALPDAPIPVNKAAPFSRVPQPTPPSAQVPVIPCTYNSASSPERPPAKRIRLEKSIIRNSSPPAPERAAGLFKETSELERTSLHLGSKSSNTSTSTPSFLAGVSQERASQQPTAPVPELRSSNSLTSTPSFLAGKSQENTSQQSTGPMFVDSQDSQEKSQETNGDALSVPGIQTNPPALPDMSGAGQGATPSRDQLAKGAAEEAANDGSQVTSGSHEVLLSPETFTHHPYSAYMRTYEKYEGNLKNYVRACVYLEYLQRRRWLSSFLYDDFIRAFTNYIRYVENLDEDNQPLSAVEWYNETVDKPQYTKGIVTRHNLEGILKTYPEQVSTAYDSQEKRTLLAEAQLTGREAISPALEESQPLQESGGEDTTQAPEKADGNVEKVSGSPRLHSSTSIHVGSDSFEEKNASDEVTEVAATQDVGTIVTQPPIVSPRLTQPSVDRTQRIPQTVLKTKMAPPPLPRKSVISSPADAARPPSLPANSPLASVVSRTSSTKSRRKIEGPERKSKTKSRRKDEDPDARSRRFQKFLERRRRGSATPASSIVSSSYGKGSE